MYEFNKQQTPYKHKKTYNDTTKKFVKGECKDRSGLRNCRYIIDRNYYMISEYRNAKTL